MQGFASRGPFFRLQINCPHDPVSLINRCERTSIRRCFCLCVHMYTFQTHAGESRLLGMKSHGKELARRWPRASFPPFDENHVSGATRAEKKGTVSENTSAAASSQRPDGRAPLSPIRRPFSPPPCSVSVAPCLISTTFLSAPFHRALHTSPGGLPCPYVRPKAGRGGAGGFWRGFVFAQR